MTTGLKQLAFAAVCSTALIAITGVAQAGTVGLLAGSALATAPNPLYGTAAGSNNVINSQGVTPTGSALYDPTTTDALLHANTPWVQQSQVSSNTTSAAGYFVNWYFTGAESGYNIAFNAPGVTTFTEANQNNSFNGGGPPLTSGSFQYLGTSHYGVTAGVNDALAFDLSWTGGGGGSIDNSGVQTAPSNAGANLIFSYLDITTLFSGPYANLTTQPGDWFAFALNDTGGPDDNHDDFVGFAQIVPDTGGGPGPGVTPIPAALPLFGSVLGGGIFVGNWRKRRKNRKKATV